MSLTKRQTHDDLLVRCDVVGRHATVSGPSPMADALQAELGIESVAPAFLVALPVFRPTAPPDGEIDDVEEVRRRPGFSPCSGAKRSVSLVLLNVTVQSGAGGGPLGGRALVEHDHVCHPPVAPTTVLPPILARLDRSRGSMASAPRQSSGPSSLAVIQTLTADGSVLLGDFLACRSGAREQGHDNGGGGRRDRTRAGCAHIARATRRPRSGFLLLPHSGARGRVSSPSSSQPTQPPVTLQARSLALFIPAAHRLSPFGTVSCRSPPVQY